ncbi:MAG: HK97 family phage prohead protease [Roseitalea porphyridii]|jgi:HK97 family phage prohead protease|uniref:HK97 family phage prohead protease n=1 Tax=Roseitalea porphyridii TaxID=1852022 RepID=UPI0032EDD130
MLFAATGGDLELRRRAGGGFKLRGRFPYGKTATLSDGGRNGGRPRKERFAPKAFEYNVSRDDVNIHFLSGHRYDKPLASRKARTLELNDTDDALEFDATITPEIEQTTWGRDFLSAFAAGLVTGLSPGFRLPPQRTVPNAETVEDEDPSDGNAIIRTINAALLFELSAVTQPAYDEAQIEARNWKVSGVPTGATSRVDHLRRWRL